MENQKERFWQSPDMTVTKTVIVEGDLNQDLGKFGSVMKLEISEHDFEDVEVSITEPLDDFTYYVH